MGRWWCHLGLCPTLWRSYMASQHLCCKLEWTSQFVLVTSSWVCASEHLCTWLEVTSTNWKCLPVVSGKSSEALQLQVWHLWIFKSENAKLMDRKGPPEFHLWIFKSYKADLEWSHFQRWDQRVWGLQSFTFFPASKLYRPSEKACIGLCSEASAKMLSKNLNPRPPRTPHWELSTPH